MSNDERMNDSPQNEGRTATFRGIMLENLNKEYKLGYHKAAKMAEIATWADIWAVTGLDKKLMSDANMTPFDTVDDAVKEALKENKDAKIIILMDGSVTIPMVN